MENLPYELVFIIIKVVQNNIDVKIECIRFIIKSRLRLCCRLKVIQEPKTYITMRLASNSPY